MFLSILRNRSVHSSCQLQVICIFCYLRVICAPTNAFEVQNVYFISLLPDILKILLPRFCSKLCKTQYKDLYILK